MTAIWLMPFQPSPGKDDGYDISDYYGVDPRYGTLGDFVEFTHGCQQRGIRVIIDLVVNHTSDAHLWFRDARCSPDSQHRDWYVWADKRPASASKGMVFPGVQKSTWTHDKEAKTWFFHRFYDFQPDLNTSNPYIQAALADRSETKGARERLSKHLIENVRRGRKRRTPIDGARTVVPSQARSGNRLQKLSVLIIEGRAVLSPSGFPLLLQGTQPRYFCLRGADCFHPYRLFLRLRRLTLLSDRWHHRQHWCRHSRAIRDGLRSHWAGGRWFAFRHRDTASRSVKIDVEGRSFQAALFY
jgi:hypothetical protein